MKKKLILIGGGGHCKSCIDVIEQEGLYAIAGILDSGKKIGEAVLDYPVIGNDDMLPALIKKHYFLITVGQIHTAETRFRLYIKLVHLHAKQATIISAHAYVSRHASIGDGTIIMHGATVNAAARIGSNCIINSHALIEHDAIIHDHCHIATGAIINGGVAIGSQTFIGSRAMTREYISIGSQSFIAGGMNIYADLPEKSEVKPR
ncbi:MAG: acetyltransferase [Desulfobulbaceae bacterium]|nr:acetyltransferase [Desulfobulbaceae bacterium]